LHSLGIDATGPRFLEKSDLIEAYVAAKHAASSTTSRSNPPKVAPTKSAPTDVLPSRISVSIDEFAHASGDSTVRKDEQAVVSSIPELAPMKDWVLLCATANNAPCHHLLYSTNHSPLSQATEHTKQKQEKQLLLISSCSRHLLWH
jgi:hypothetical protein